MLEQQRSTWFLREYKERCQIDARGGVQGVLMWDFNDKQQQTILLWWIMIFIDDMVISLVVAVTRRVHTMCLWNCCIRCWAFDFYSKGAMFVRRSVGVPLLSDMLDKFPENIDLRRQEVEWVTSPKHMRRWSHELSLQPNIRGDEFIPHFFSIESNITWDKLIPNMRDDPAPSLIDTQPNAPLVTKTSFGCRDLFRPRRN
jgi:hypothetical protein